MLSYKICSQFFDNSIAQVEFSLSNLTPCESREPIGKTTSLTAVGHSQFLLWVPSALCRNLLI